MHIMIITEDGLIATATRLMVALNRTHEVTVRTAAQSLRLPPPPTLSGSILLGVFPESDRVMQRGTCLFDHFGIRWGAQRNRAWIRHGGIGADTTIDEVEDAISGTRGRVASVSLDSLPKELWRGRQFAKRFLDPHLRVPETTVLADGDRYTPERKRQYRQLMLGISTFLLDGFDAVFS